MDLPPPYVDLISQFLPAFEVAGVPEQLSGGALNYVWRLRGGPGSIPSSVILKWSPPYVASLPRVPLDPHRSVIEARAMLAFEPGCSLAALAAAGPRPPQLLAYDERLKLLVMEDVCRCPDLGAWLRSTVGTVDQANSLGAALGTFIGGLHKLTWRRPELAEEFNNAEIQRTRLTVQYCAVADYARRAGLRDADIIGEEALKLGELLQRPGISLIMGDLWPPSVLVGEGGLRIIDWELAHYGRPSQDIGHLAAHLWMHQQRAPNVVVAANAQALLRGFLKAYRATTAEVFHSLFGVTGVSESAVHFGSEILTRTVGAFQDGYLYAGLAPDDPIIQAAVRVAAQHIREPLAFDTFDALGWRSN